MLSIHDIQPGQKARVVGFNEGDKAYRQRLLAMGLLPGTEFQVSRLAPLGDPVEILVLGFSLALRKAEAAMMCLERVVE